MDFSWSSEQDRAHRLLLERIPSLLQPMLAARPMQSSFTRQEWSACAELGLLAPDPSCSSSRSLLMAARMMEAFGFAYEDMGLVFAVCAHRFACVGPIEAFGSAELKQRMIPELAAGRWVGAHAITEQDAGSDSFALSTEAALDGDAYVLNGSKSFVTNGPAADVYIVYGRTSPKHGVMGISAFAVERESRGLVVGPLHEKMGLESAPASAIELRDCRVPVGNLLGREGQGTLVFEHAMQRERTGLFAAFLGLMDRQVAEAIEYSQQRRQFGRRIGEFQAVSHRIAEMKSRSEAGRWLLYRALWLLDRGEPARLETSLAKLAVSEAAVQCALDLVRLRGGAGYLRAQGVERGLRDAIGGLLSSGTSDLQRELIAQELGV